MASTLSYTAAQIDAMLSAVSGRNLLDNWDFRNPVNQRGLTTYTSATAYGLDRWRAESTASSAPAIVRVLSGGGTRVEASVLSPATYAQIKQIVPDSASYSGKTVTLSAIVDANSAVSAQLLIGANCGGTWTFTFVTITDTGLVSVTKTIGADCRQLYVLLRGADTRNGDAAGSYTDFLAAKLELGTISTLANDPPVDYGTELARCKRYFRKWTTAAARTEALKECDLMRTTPVLSTITIDGVTYYTSSADL